MPKMAAQLTAPTPPPVAKTFVRVFVAFGGDWLELWLAEAAMVVSLRRWLVESGNSRVERAEGEAS